MNDIPTTLKELSGGSKFDTFNIQVADLVVDPSFNLRRRKPAWLEHVREIANSMKPPGSFIRSFPLTVRMRDGRAMIRDGHARYAAVLLANEEGAEIISIPVVQVPKGTNEEDDVLLMLQSGTTTGMKLEPLEQAEGVKRLLANGWSEEKITGRMGRTRQWLANLLTLAEAPSDVQAMVDAGEVAATEAVKVVRSNGADASATLVAAREHAQASGKTRVTAKNIRAVDTRKANHAGPTPRDKGAWETVERAREVVELWDACPTFSAKSPRDLADAIEAMRKGLP